MSQRYDDQVEMLRLADDLEAGEISDLDTQQMCVVIRALRLAGLLATAAGAVIADWSADCKVEDETIAKLLEAYNAAGCQRALLQQVEVALD